MTTGKETAESGYLTVENIAVDLGVSKMTVYRMIHAGEIEAIQVGTRSYRITRGAYTAYLDGSVYIPQQETEN